MRGGDASYGLARCGATSYDWPLIGCSLAPGDANNMFTSHLFSVSLALLAQNGPGDGAFNWLPGLVRGPWFPFIVIGVMFYLLLIRPERRKRAEMNQMLDNLKKNDHVVTVGGVFGVVVNAQKGSEDITIRVDDTNNTRLRILRSAVSRVTSAGQGQDKDAS